MDKPKESPTGQGGAKEEQNSKAYNSDNSHTDPTGQAKNAESNPQTGPFDKLALDQLLDEIAAVLSLHLSLPEGAAVAMALWILHTHTIGNAEFTPRLALLSPVPNCGKTTALEVLQLLCRDAIRVDNTSAPAIYRIPAARRPTILLDEADTYLAGDAQLQNVLHSGHRRGGTVMRCKGEEFESGEYFTFMPVAIAMIGQLPTSQLESRSIIIPMRRARADEPIEKLRSEVRQRLVLMRKALESWALSNGSGLEDAQPALPPGFRNRLADNWRLLLAIAELAGEHWAEKARKAAILLSSADDRPSAEILLAGIRDVFREQKAEKISSADLCQKLSKFELHHNQQSLAKSLRPFGIGPKGVRIDDKTPKGYDIRQFEDAWSRYLSSGREEQPRAEV